MKVRARYQIESRLFVVPVTKLGLMFAVASNNCSCQLFAMANTICENQIDCFKEVENEWQSHSIRCVFAFWSLFSHFSCLSIIFVFCSVLSHILAKNR